MVGMVDTLRHPTVYLQLCILLANVKQQKGLVARKANICVHRMTRRLKENGGEYPGVGSKKLKEMQRDHRASCSDICIMAITVAWCRLLNGTLFSACSLRGPVCLVEQ
jgi:hypothetical protein